MAQARQTQSAPKGSSGVVRKNGLWLTIVGVAATVVVGLTSIIPPLAAGINHAIDRVTNGIKSKRELKARMEWYRPQIAKTLGMSDPLKVTLRDFKMAATINPSLANAVLDVKRDEAKENRNSMLFNGATAWIPGMAVVDEAYKTAKFVNGAATIGAQMAVTTTGGLLLDWAHKKHVNAQEVAEGISSQLNAAREQGRDPREVVTPQMVFLLRIAQDAALEEEIKTRFKKPFQQMSDAEQQQVMLNYKPLADAVTSEAYAVSQNIMPVQDLMANAPNLKSSANKYTVGARNGSFVDNLNAQRELAQQAASTSRAN